MTLKITMNTSHPAIMVRRYVIQNSAILLLMIRPSTSPGKKKRNSQIPNNQVVNRVRRKTVGVNKFPSSLFFKYCDMENKIALRLYYSMDFGQGPFSIINMIKCIGTENNVERAVRERNIFSTGFLYVYIGGIFIYSHESVGQRVDGKFLPVYEM